MPSRLGGSPAPALQWLHLWFLLGGPRPLQPCPSGWQDSCRCPQLLSPQAQAQEVRRLPVPQNSQAASLVSLGCPPTHETVTGVLCIGRAASRQIQGLLPGDEDTGAGWTDSRPSLWPRGQELGAWGASAAVLHVSCVGILHLAQAAATRRHVFSETCKMSYLLEQMVLLQV